MFCTLAFATLTLLVGNNLAAAQQIPSETTAAELWNPWTWFWPYAIATAEGYRDFYQKAQKATNELYQQIYKTNAFPWITGDWSSPGKAPVNSTQPNQGGNDQNNSTQTNPGENSGAPNQGNSTQPSQNQTNQNNSGNAPQTDQKNETTTEGNGAQVQGNVQSNGTADAEVNGKVD